MDPKQIFITGATGYIGSRLAERLVARGHGVRALVRPNSAERLPAGVTPVLGDAIDAGSFRDAIQPGETVVQLVGTPHPSPAKAAQFVSVDLASARATIENAARNRAGHFVYMSVAHPAPAMHAYIAARVEGERLLRESGLPATILRPWYVLGPGHRWAHALQPLYWLAERIPPFREGALRLGLVTIEQMVSALTRAVESTPATERIWGVAEIRANRRIR